MPFYNWSEMKRTAIHGRRPYDQRHEDRSGHYRFAAGNGATPHKHPEEQVINVVSGKFRVRVGGGERNLKAGDAVLIPPDTEHEASTVDGEVEVISCKYIVGG